MPRIERNIVGIVGGSCAGKSWLAGALQQRLGSGATRISQDDFYLDRGHLSFGRRARLNFDHPRAIDWARLEEVLRQFACGEAARVPRYDFVTHSRMALEGTLAPARILLVEGLWLFRRASLRDLFQLKIFLRGSNELCQERRLRRDTQERGRTPEQVREQWQRHTYPMFQKFVAPQERWADVVLEAPVAENEVAKLAERLESAATVNVNEMIGI